MTLASSDKILEEILKSQQAILEELRQQRGLIDSIQEKVERLEQSRELKEADPKVPPSLIRVLKGLSESPKPVSTEEAADRVNLSRNLVSGYLNRLSDLGYVSKEPNLDSGGSRYLFKPNYSALPSHLKELLKRYEK
jgi:predicted transcriptional regulator